MLVQNMRVHIKLISLHLLLWMQTTMNAVLMVAGVHVCKTVLTFLAPSSVPVILDTTWIVMDTHAMVRRIINTFLHRVQWYAYIFAEQLHWDGFPSYRVVNLILYTSELIYMQTLMSATVVKICVNIIARTPQAPTPVVVKLDIDSALMDTVVMVSFKIKINTRGVVNGLSQWLCIQI